MLIVRGRLLGTLLSLAIAALGALLLGRTPVPPTDAPDCTATPTAVVAALR